jgi:hypothetical protein
MADVAKFMKDRQAQQLDKRVAVKLQALPSLSQT